MGVVNVMEEEGRSKIPSMINVMGRAQRRLKLPFSPSG
jgi:hypothetical protein